LVSLTQRNSNLRDNHSMGTHLFYGVSLCR